MQACVWLLRRENLLLLPELVLDRNLLDRKSQELRARKQSLLPLDQELGFLVLWFQRPPPGTFPTCFQC